jgi:hypothetical protein
VTYQWTMHSDIRNLFSTDGTAFRLEAPSGAVLTGATGDANGATAVYGEPWDATRYNATAPLVHNIVKSTTLQQQDFDHLAVLGVTEPGGPEVAVGRVAATGGTVLAASWPGSEVLVASKAHEASSVASARLSTDAAMAMAMVGVGTGETTLVDGSSLVADGRTHATITGGRGSVVVGGSTVEASGPAGATFRVHAPQAIDAVTLNGTAVTFGREGDEIVFPASVPQVGSLGVSPSAAGEGEPVRVSAHLGSGPLPVTSCSIDHGDGSPVVAGTVIGSSCTGPVHRYADDGVYAVRVRATNAVGEGAGTITHAILNRAPVVGAPVVARDASGHLVTASATFADGGAADGPFTCAVDYGDGLGAVPGVVSGSTCSASTHLYRRPGLYAVTVWVTDKDGGTGARAAPYDLR